MMLGSLWLSHHSQRKKLIVEQISESKARFGLHVNPENLGQLAQLAQHNWHSWHNTVGTTQLAQHSWHSWHNAVGTVGTAQLAQLFYVYRLNDRSHLEEHKISWLAGLS